MKYLIAFLSAILLVCAVSAQQSSGPSLPKDELIECLVDLYFARAPDAASKAPERNFKEMLYARFGRGKAQRGTTLLDRQAAGRHAFVRRARGVARNHRDSAQAHVELIGDDLRERGGDALAQLDLAGKHGHSTVGIDGQPCVELAIGLQAARQRWRCGGARRLGISWGKRQEIRHARHHRVVAFQIAIRNRA